MNSLKIKNINVMGALHSQLIINDDMNKENNKNKNKNKNNESKTNLSKYSLSEVSKHNKDDDCWVVVNG